MAKILEEGPIRRRLREKGLVKQSSQEMSKGEVFSRLMSVMEEYAAHEVGTIPMKCDILARELTRAFELSGDEHVALRERCIQRARRGF